MLSNRSVVLLLLILPLTIFGQGLIIPSGAYVITTNTNLITYKNFTSNGSFNADNGTLIFAGTTQVLSGTTNTIFNKITVNAGSTTTVNSNQQLAGVLLNYGSLNANGNLTLLSTAAQTALIDGRSTGTITGNLTMQRYLAAGFGYKYFSSPFQAATVNAFSSTVDITAAFPNFYTYIENKASSGWTAYTNPANPLNPFQGYAADFGAATAPKMVSITGLVNSGSLTTKLYNTNQPYTLGFNLIGNPYPSPIDWNASSGWTKTNIDNAIYFFDSASNSQYTGTYSSYINGVSSDGIANNIIASMQGFFVHVSPGSYPVTGTLTINNSARVNELSPIFHKSSLNEVNDVNPRILLRLSAGFSTESNSSDPIVIYFDEQASKGFDTSLDAIKLMNTNEHVPNLYSIAPDASRLAINALPSIDSNTVIPLGLRLDHSGTIDFNLRDAENLPPDLPVYLNDAKTGKNQILRRNEVYSIPIEAGNLENRFSIRFRAVKTTMNAEKDIFNVFSSGGKLIVDLNFETDQKGDLILYNLLGQLLSRDSLNGNGHYELHTHAISGVYIIRYVSPRSVHSKKIVISN